MHVKKEGLRKKGAWSKEALNYKNRTFNDVKLPVNFKINIKKSNEDLFVEKLLKITGKTKEELKILIDRL